MRRLLYAAALVVFVTALGVGLTIPSAPGTDCSRMGGALLRAVCEQTAGPADHRVPLRVGIIGTGLVLALVVAALAARSGPK